MFERQTVMSATCVAQIEIYNGGLELAGESLGAGDHGGGAVEEHQRQGRVAVARFLIAHKSGDTHDTLAAHPQQIAQHGALWQ